MKIAALSLLVAFAFVGANAGGAERCTWGPSYWCTSIKEAKECSAVKHCINHNWAKLPIKEDTTDVCEMCELAIEAIRGFIFTPGFEEEVKEAWDQICTIIPFAEVKEECTLIGTYIPAFLEMVKSALHPQQACTAIGLCKSENVLASFAPLLGDECHDCTNFLGDIKARAEKKDKAQVEKDLMELCSTLGEYVGMCEMLIAQYSEQIYDGLVSLDAEKVCKFGGMCGSMSGVSARASLASVLPQLNLGDDCQDCIIFLADIVKRAKAKTQDQVEEDIKHLCGILGAYEGLCTDLVGQNIEAIYDFLAHKLDSVKICTASGMCEA